MPADYVHQVPGPCEILVDGEKLGFTDRGAQIQHYSYHTDVPCDDHGGELGPPSDREYFGERYVVRLMLTKFKTATISKLEPLLKGNPEGQPGDVGTLVFADKKFFTLSLKSDTDPWHFYCATLVGEPTDIPQHGSRWQGRSYTFECFQDPDADSHTFSKTCAHTLPS